MCEAMQMPQLAHNPSFETLPSRLRNQDELDDIIGRWTRQTSRYHVAQLLQERGVPAGPVLDCGADTYDNPHLQDRDYFQVVDHPDAGTHLHSGQIWKMANRPESPSRPSAGPRPAQPPDTRRSGGNLLRSTRRNGARAGHRNGPAARRGHGRRTTRASTGSHSPGVAPRSYAPRYASLRHRRRRGIVIVGVDVRLIGRRDRQSERYVVADRADVSGAYPPARTRYRPLWPR